MHPNIFLLNVHSDRNAGDLALSRVTIQQLETNFPGSKITLSMNDPESYHGEHRALSSFFPWLWKGKRWERTHLVWLIPATLTPLLTRRLFGRAWFGLTPKALRDWTRAYAEADLVVSTAGGFYRSTGSGLTLLLTSYSMILAIITHKPLYIFPQSIGPFSFKWERRLARWLFSRARIVMAREPISVGYLKECGLKEHQYRMLPDVAFGFVGQPQENARAWLRSLGIDSERERPLMGMTVINWGATDLNFKNQDGYEKAILSTIRFFIENYHGKVLLMPQTWGPTPAEDDRITARRIADHLPDLHASILAPQSPLQPELLQAVFGEMDLVIGTRMHSNIFSVSRGVPVIPIGYEPKSLGIATSIGLDRWVIDIRDVNETNLIKNLVTIWGELEEVRCHLKERVPLLIEESQTAGKLVADDYFRLAQVINNG